MFKILKLVIIIAVLFSAAIFISTAIRPSSNRSKNPELKISTSTLSFETFQKTSTTSENTVSENTVKVVKPKPKAVSNTGLPMATKEVSPKSFEELVNNSIIQLYCGYFNNEAMTFSDISRGTGIIFDKKGEILTNRHIIYDESFKKIRSDCFVLKSPFPNEKSQNPKIYYLAEILSYPLEEKFSGIFSQDKYYNDFAILKISGKPENNSKISLLLGFDYAAPDDYLTLEKDGAFNFLPIDWSYQPKDSDLLITLGYGIDASHSANQITSTIGKLSGNVDVNGSLKPQILLIESNATQGFSGGALINPQSKGLVGLISWITSGEETGKYTVAIFRDFLRDLMLRDLNFDLK